MDPETKRLLQQMEQATSSSPPTNKLDEETQQLRETWLQFGELLSQLDEPEPPPVVRKPTPPQLPRKHSTLDINVMVAIVVAASMLAAVGLGMYAWNLYSARTPVPSDQLVQDPKAVPRDVVPRDVVPRDVVPRDVVPRDVVPQNDVVVQDDSSTESGPREVGTAPDNEPVNEPTVPGEADQLANDSTEWDSLDWEDDDLDDEISQARESVLVFDQRWRSWDRGSLAVDYQLDSLGSGIEDGAL